MKFKVGDSVVIIAGKDRGKSGSISRIFKTKNQVLVEGINKKIKHIKKRDGEAGERVEFFAPLHLSNIAIVDPEKKVASRIGYVTNSKGEKIRIYKKSGKEITDQASTKAPKTKTVIKA